MSINQTVAATIANLLGQYQQGGRAETESYLSVNLRLLHKWRSILLANTIVRRDGARIFSGPFAGMTYVESATEGGLAPRLLGTYESELHPEIERILARRPTRIIDIGCAEGYYAVGLARIAPWAEVLAFDISEKAQIACRGLANANGVGDRVHVDGELTPERLNALCADGAFVFCDIEGGEADLLDPARAPALAGCSLIVETHPDARPGVTELLKARFQDSHLVEDIRETVKDVPIGHWLRDQPQQDRFLATWEWRYTPTPWLAMTPNAPAVAAEVQTSGSTS